MNFLETDVPTTGGIKLCCSQLRTGSGLAWDFSIPGEAGRRQNGMNNP